MGLIDEIRDESKKSGASKGKFIYFREDEKVRIRILSELEDGEAHKVVFHDSFKEKINMPCLEEFGKNCPACEDDDLRTRNLYILSVYDYEAKEVKLLMAAATSFSPITTLAGFYENYGTLTDRDYTIQKKGSGTSTSFVIMPGDKKKFRDPKAKPYSKSAILKFIKQAYPIPDVYNDGYDDEDTEDDTDNKYSKMTAKELYNECKDRGLEVEQKKTKTYYEKMLIEDDEASDSWGDEETEDEKDYSSMTAKELYDICKEKELEPKPKQKKEYYLEMLENADEERTDLDDWLEDEEKDEWDEE